MMQKISVLDVGHGLCTVVGTAKDVFVFDCGSHGQSHVSPTCGKRLAQRTAFEEIGTIAVSHLHRDHYSGLLEDLPNLRSNVRVVIGRLPRIMDHPQMGSDFLARLLAYNLDPKYGPLDIDLLRKLREWAPDLIPRPISLGEDFLAGGERWTVLWPPRSLDADSAGFASIKKAIEAYDVAAKEHPELYDNLNKIRESDTYRELLDELDEIDNSKEYKVGQTHQDSSRAFGNTKSARNNDKGLIRRAGDFLRKAANEMSLVIVSDSGILFTGDASPRAMACAFSASTHEFSVVVTPHHGGRNYVPESVHNQTLRSKIWVSPTGSNYSRHTWRGYDFLPGSHFRTDEDGDVDLLVPWR